MTDIPTMSLLSILSAYGDIVELDYTFGEDTINEVKELNYVPAPNGKLACNLTGPLDDIGLDSPPDVKHQKGQEYNSNLDKCPTIKKFFDHWTELARCRIAIMNQGSFFRPHRDAYRLNEQFRIFIPLNKTGDEEWTFLYDGEVRRFKEGRPYILNTRKTHASFAMDDGCYHILMSVFLNEHNIKKVGKLLPRGRELEEAAFFGQNNMLGKSKSKELWGNNNG